MATGLQIQPDLQAISVYTCSHSIAHRTPSVTFLCSVQQFLMFGITQHLAHGLCSLRKVIWGKKQVISPFSLIR